MPQNEGNIDNNSYMHEGVVTNASLPSEHLLPFQALIQRLTTAVTTCSRSSRKAI